jgi:hypothetical protein
MKIDQPTYDNFISQYLQGARLPFAGAVTYFEPNTGSYLLTGCIDAETFSRGIAGVIVQGDIPDVAKTALSIAAFVFKFAHFQLTVAISESASLSTTLQNSFINAIAQLPGDIKQAYLTQIKQNSTSCPSYWSALN